MSPILQLLFEQRLPHGGRVAVAQAPVVDERDGGRSWSGNERDASNVRRLAASLLTQKLGWGPEYIVIEPVRCAAGCPFCGSIAGVGGLQVSLSHSRGLVAVAFSKRSIGVDVERLDVRPQPAIAHGRPHFWDAWTREEAIWKARAAMLCGSERSDVPRVEVILQYRDARFIVAVAVAG